MSERRLWVIEVRFSGENWEPLPKTYSAEKNALLGLRTTRWLRRKDVYTRIVYYGPYPTPEPAEENKG